jgi:hypothetical protein
MLVLLIDELDLKAEVWYKRAEHYYTLKFPSDSSNFYELHAPQRVREKLVYFLTTNRLVHTNVFQFGKYI